MRTGPNGACGPYDDPQIAWSNGYNTYLNNDCWADPKCKQTLYANDPGDWQVSAQEPKGNTGVMSYPDVQQLVSKLPLSSLNTLDSTFKETMPHNSDTHAEAAYDIFLGDWAQEVMIWEDNVNQSLSYDTKLAQHTFNGVSYTLYRNGGPGGELIWSRDTNISTETVHILPMLNWLLTNGYVSKSNNTLIDVDFGWEVSSTGGVPETFSISRFSLTTT